MKQNLIEIGDTYYIDDESTITEIPPGLGLEDGIWIMTPNGDAGATSSAYITFDVDRTVNVYIAYDLDDSTPSAAIPDWLSGYADTGQQLAVSDPAAQFKLYQRTVGPGQITLGGNMAQGASGADVNYIVIVVEQ